MNYPPGMSPPPAGYGAPPQQRSSVVKWIVIGCGGLLGLVLLSCGGCAFWGMMIAKSAQEQQQAAETRIRASKIVERELGPIRKVQMVAQPQEPGQRQNVVLSFQVEGEQASGRVQASLLFSGMGFKLGTLTLTKEGETREIPLEEPSSQ